MDRTNAPGHVNHLFVAEDAATNRAPTELVPEDFNAHQEELINVILAAQIVPNAANNAQVIEALNAMYAPRAIGKIELFAINVPPIGYLKANGALVSRTTYSALFAAIGTVFGAGDGATTFALPDLRGEFIRGWDDGRGIDSGRVFGSAQADAFEAHTHSIIVETLGGNNGGVGPGTAEVPYAGNTGSTGDTETRPRNIALLACIKY